MWNVFIINYFWNIIGNKLVHVERVYYQLFLEYNLYYT